MQIFYLVSVLLIFLGIVMYKDFLNPVTIYNIIWGIIVALYSLRLTSLQDELSIRLYEYLLLVSFCFSSTCIIASKVRLVNFKLKGNETISIDKVNRLFYFWLAIEIIEVVYSKGVPIIWSLSGNGKTYFDFGIPSIHGFANAFGLALVSVFFSIYLVNKYNNKRLLYSICIMILFYACLLTRQVIISMVVQMFIIYCFYRRKIPWRKMLIIAIVGILLFGILGNIRTGYTAFLNVAMINTDINPLFIGVYWVYMYLTMTIANLNKVFSLNFVPIGAIHIFSVYMPSIIRNALFKNNTYELPNYLVTQAFNVSGYFMDFYLSYKVAGIVFIAVIYGLLGGVIYKKIRKSRNQKNIIYYAIYLQILSLSFFYNHLLYLPSGFQFIIIWLIFKNIKLKFKR